MLAWALKMRPATFVGFRKRLSEASFGSWSRLAHSQPTAAGVLPGLAVPFATLYSCWISKFVTTCRKVLFFLACFTQLPVRRNLVTYTTTPPTHPHNTTHPPHTDRHTQTHIPTPPHTHTHARTHRHTALTVVM